MDRPAKRFALFAAGAAVVGGYLVACGWAVWVQNIAAVLILIRTALVSLGFTGIALCLWWMLRAKTYTLRSLVLGIPLLVSVLAIPLPYYSHGRSVQHSLQQAGVQYRVQADGFARTLQQLAADVFSLESPNLFAAQLTFIRIDLATTKQDHLLKLGRHPNLQVVNIIKSASDQQLRPSTIQWINALPRQARVTLALDNLDEYDLRQLKSIYRTLNEIHVLDNPSSASVIHEIMQCPAESLYFFDIGFPSDFATPNAPVFEPAFDRALEPSLRLNDVRVHRCKITGAQLVRLAELTSCSTLNCDNLVTEFAISDCEQLATLPCLEYLYLGTTQLRFDQLQPLVASTQLKSFSTSTVSSTSEAELEQLRALIPEGCNRRVRVDYGPGISVGSVRRGP